MNCQGDPTCQEVLEHLCELVDVEAGEGTIEAGEGGLEALDARAWALLAEHVRGCPHCADALDAERLLRAVLRRCCSEQDHAPESLRLRVVSATTIFWRG